MLRTLRTVDRQTAEAALAATTLSLLPNPLGDDPAESFSFLSRNILSEIRERLGIDSTDQSSTSNGRILDSLNTELTKLVLSPRAEQAARKRLGQRGNLSPRLYRLQFHEPYFTDTIGRFGMRRAYIEEAVANPDRVEHLLPDRFRDAQGAPSISLFSKYRSGDSDNNDDFVLLVQATRESDNLIVDAAWRVYAAEVPMDKTSAPLAILRAFVARYGLVVRVVDSLPSEFVLYETRLLEPGQQHSNLIQFDRPPDSDGMVSFVFRINELSVLEIAVAYGVNTTLYAADLIRHGVHVTPSSP